MYNEKYALDFPNSHYLSNLNNLNGTNQSIHLNRLPTLGEILANKSKSPVDLFTFYQFMKDVEGKIDYLDFWFDLINHLNSSTTTTTATTRSPNNIFTATSTSTSTARFVL